MIWGYLNQSLLKQLHTNNESNKSKNVWTMLNLLWPVALLRFQKLLKMPNRKGLQINNIDSQMNTKPNN